MKLAHKSPTRWSLPFLAGSLAILTSNLLHCQTVNIQVTDTGNATSTYVPFDKALSVNATVYLDANTDPNLTRLRATQRDLGFREVDYKAALFNTLTGSTPSSVNTSGNVTTVSYTGIQNSKNARTILGYWMAKDVPIVIGPDGMAYITDGHHTTAGFLETTGSDLTPGTTASTTHIVIGHIVANYYSGSNGIVQPTDANFWNTMSATNNAYLYGQNGNPLGGAGATPPISVATSAMPQIPGRASGGVGMVNDKYRSLTWGMADGILSTATSSMKFNTYNGTGAFTGLGTAKTTGYLKVNSTDPNYTAQPDVNFVEFYYADYLRNRVVWDDTKTGHAIGLGQTDSNLISAPIGFFASVANGNALTRSELYKDQNGKNVADYVGNADPNVNTWARADIRNGLAVPGDVYHMYLLDDAGVNGDIFPSGNSTNTLHVDVTVPQTVSNNMTNFSAILVNAGGNLTTKWKDAAMNGQNSNMTVTPGTAAVIFTGNNDYSKLTSLQISGGSLTVSNPSATSINASLTGSGAFIKSGNQTLSLTGNSSSFTGATTVNGGKLSVNGAFGSQVTVQSSGILGGNGTFGALATIQNGAHLAPGNSAGTITFAQGLTLQSGSQMDFELGLSSDKILLTGGNLTATSAADPNRAMFHFTLTGGVNSGNFTIIDWSGSSTAGIASNQFQFDITPGYSASLNVVGSTLQVSVVPEPGSITLFGVGLVSLAFLARRRKA